MEHATQPTDRCAGALPGTATREIVGEEGGYGFRRSKLSEKPLSVSR